MEKKKNGTEMKTVASEITERMPDCVTQMRKGNKIITARGFFRLEGKETALDKMERVILTEGKVSGF